MSLITVKDAHARGRVDVVFPAIVSSFFILLLIMVAMAFASFFLGIAMLPLVVVIPAIIHCIMVTDWKIWAFENVRNVHELDREAKKEGIIIEWLEGFISVSRKDQLRLEKIREKFSQPDIHPADEAFNENIEVFYNKKMNLVEAYLYFGGAIIGLVWTIMASQHGPAFEGVIVMVAALAMCVFNLIQYCNRTPQIVFRADGIVIHSSIIAKEQITDIKVRLNRKTPNLCVSEKGNLIDTTIGAHDLDLTTAQLSEIAAVFKRRWGIDKDHPEMQDDEHGKRYMK